MATGILASSLESRLRTPLQLSLTRHVTPGQEVAGTSPAMWDMATVVTRNRLDRTLSELRDVPENVGEAMTGLMSDLWSLRAQNTPDVWQDVVGQCRAHPVRHLIHQDPFTGRSFNKPRGYSGDAVLIDYIYTRNCRLSEADSVTPMGETVFSFIRDTPACAAVRSRRDLVASAIDQVCSRTKQPRILSVACGHLREAMLSESVSGGRVGRFIALDHDQQSMGVVEREAAPFGVTPVCNSIKGLFRGPLAEEKFDFIYSTGLYDYLDERMATRLTQRMFEMLSSQGRLLVANFLPDIWCAGYMETYMDWKLIYRSPEQMGKLTSSIADAEIAGNRTFIEENENIVFLELIKR